jgi:hypothetical protein
LKVSRCDQTVFAEALKVAELKSYLEGSPPAQATTGFSDETFRSILDKDGLTSRAPDGSAIA